MEFTRKIAVAAIGGLSAIAPAAFAATETTSLTVTASVTDTCIVAATAVAFGPLSGGTDTVEITTGNIALSCTANKTGVTVALGAGENESGGQRRMDDDAGNFVPYDLYADNGRDPAIGVNGNIFEGNVTAAIPENIPVYGKVPAGSYSAGTYVDTVVITVTYP